MAEKHYKDDLPGRFIRQLKRETLPKSEKAVYDKLRGWRVRTVYEAVVEYAEILDGRTEKTLHRGCLVLIHNLRRILIRSCLRYVNADLTFWMSFNDFET